MIKIKFENSIVKQANYYCFLAKHIQNGFYQKQQLIILPYLSNCFQSIYFPKIGLSNAFWKAIVTCPHSNITRSFPKEAVDEVKTRLKTTKTKNFDWNFSAVPAQLENEFEQIKSVTILQTYFGTKSSFYFSKKSRGVNVFITLRDDQATETINWSLINILLLMKDPEFAYKKFSERRAIVDFLTNLKKERGANSRELIDQNVYLNQLGFGQKNVIKKVNGEIFIGTKLARLHLSKQELKLLELFVENRGKIMSHDEIFNRIWGEKDFSLWAITQLVHRLKTKIKNLGVTGETILSLKNQGYLLN